MHFDGTTFANSINFFVGLAFDIDRVRSAANQPRDIGDNFASARSDLGLFADDCAIDVANLPSRFAHSVYSFTQKNCRVCAFILGIVVWKELANVGQPKCTQNCISDCMQQNIAIGVCNKTSRMFYLNSAEYKLFALACRGSRLEAMQVIAMSDPHRVISPSSDS